MSANPPDTPHTPSDTDAMTPSSSKLDLTVVRHVSSYTNLEGNSGAPSASGPSGVPTERTRLLAGSRQGYNGEDSDADSLRGRQHRSVDSGNVDQNASTASKQPLRQASGVAKKIRQRSKYYVPITEWLPQYNWTLFGGDFVAGVSVACLMVPQAMSYASGLANLNPVAGLWSTSLPPLIYGLLGTSRQMSMGPEASLSLMLGHLINSLLFSDPHKGPDEPDAERAAIAVVATFQAGLITAILGLLRLGFLDVVLSRALLRGFITAIGVIIFIEQLIPLLGIAEIIDGLVKPPASPIPKFIFILQHITHLNKYTAILSICCLSFLVSSKIFKQRLTRRPGGRWLRFVPEILIVVVTTTFLTSIFRWDLDGVDILGKVKGETSIPFGLPISSRTVKYFNSTFSTAFVMALVGVVDSMVAAREAATKYSYPVSPNRELVALGSTNLLSSCLTVTGCLPIFGSLTRTRLNGQAGARTQMASMVTATLVLVSIFFLPLLYFLPRCVLASIITTVVYGILAEAPHDIIFYWKMGAWTDLIQMTGTFLLTLLFSIEIGVLVSVGFSLILVIQRSTKPRIRIIGRRPASDDWVPIEDDEDDGIVQEEIPGVLVVRVREPLSFANTGQLKERLRRLELYGPKKSHPSDAPRRESAKAVILHMGDVDEIDASALQILSELVNSYQERGVGIYFCHLNRKEYDQFRLVGIPQQLGPARFHPDVRSAMQEVETLGFGNRSARSRYASV